MKTKAKPKKVETPETPQRAREERTQWTRRSTGELVPEWYAPFLCALSKTGSVTQSIFAVFKADKSICPSRATVYRARQTDPQFAREWDEMIEVAVDALEVECRRRALEGEVRSIFRGGVKVGEERVKSDFLLLALLKAHCPKFRDHAKVEPEAQRADLVRHLPAILKALGYVKKDSLPPPSTADVFRSRNGDGTQNGFHH
ncbi:MAG: hypothetical protein ACHRXM_01995 [Isosphaerales bacterium]